MNTAVQVLCGHVFSVLLGVLLGAEFLSCAVAACFYSWGVSRLFFQVRVPFFHSDKIHITKIYHFEVHS